MKKPKIINDHRPDDTSVLIYFNKESKYKICNVCYNEFGICYNFYSDFSRREWAGFIAQSYDGKFKKDKISGYLKISDIIKNTR